MKNISLKDLMRKYKHSWVLLYFLVYMVWFMYLEKRPYVKHYLIYTKFDDYVPFNEYFVIPYLIWFGYIVVVMGYFFFTNASDFYKASIFLFGGMSFCLCIYTFTPNEQLLRPEVFAHDNIFVDLVKFIYEADSNANVCPSIHVLNSVAIFLAMFENDKIRKHKLLLTAAGILSVSICMSTVFIKQHSLVDVVCGTALAFTLYALIYKTNYSKIFATLREYRLKRQTSLTSKSSSDTI